MNRIKMCFEKMGAFLVDLLKLDQPGKGKQDLQRELAALRAENGETVRAYCVRKISWILMITAAGLGLAAASFFFCSGEAAKLEGGTLPRPDYGEGDRMESLAVEIDGKEVRELEITVQDRKYTDAEKETLTKQAIEELETLLPGENPSLEEVRTDLVFPKSLENGAVTLDWATVPYGIIDEDGTLIGAEDEKGVLVEIQGTLTCGGMETFYTAWVKVFPRVLAEEEQMEQFIRKEVEQADARERHSDTLTLPETVNGKALVWQYPGENPAVTVLLLTVLAAVMTYLQMDQQVHKKAEQRKEQLLLDYPDLMWKMTMLLGAGLGLKGTFSRISEQYQREKPYGKIRYVYEEITYACYEMQSGIPETEAYERFGRRCQLPEYIRLGSVLSQNLKKGARGLTELLETEAAASMTERKNHARKLGEQAGTKLLMPMMLMLGVVLVILMVPAFLSF